MGAASYDTQSMDAFCRAYGMDRDGNPVTPEAKAKAASVRALTGPEPTIAELMAKHEAVKQRGREEAAAAKAAETEGRTA